MGKRSTIRLLGVLTGAVVAVTFLATVTGVSYLLVGPQFFHGPLKGNDEAHALTYVTWIARHLPDVPKWFPLQGGGISFVDGYPIGAHIVVVLLHNISQMSLNTALRLVEFASIPFTAFGVYVFTLHMLKRRSLAVLAGLFYPLSAISWNWITRGGFLAQGLSIAFVPWTLLFLDLYTESGGEGSPKAHRLRRRLHLLGALFSFSAAMLTHFITGVVLLGVAPLLAACRFLLERGNDPMHLALASSIRSILAFVLLALGLMAFRVVPFLSYSSIANREGLNVIATHDLPFFSLEVLLGLESQDPLDPFARDGFTRPVAILAAAGLLLALGRRSRLAGWAVVTVASILFTMLPGLLPGLVSKFGYLWSGTNVRALIPAMVLVPFFAASGAFEVTLSLAKRSTAAEGGPTRQFRFRLSQLLRTWLVRLGPIAVTAAVLVILPRRMSGGEIILDYGPSGLRPCNAWTFAQSTSKPCTAWSASNLLTSILPGNWPDLDVAVGEPPPVPGPLPVDEGIRLDISPYQGQLVQRLNIYSDASQVNTYAFQLSLIHGMWGYQQGVFYSREYGSPAALNDLAQWFGVEFVIVHPDIDPIEKYVQAGWDRVWSDREVEIWRFPDRTGMATATSRPSLLVVGKSDADAFMNVFRVANEGMLGYEEALLVQGKARIDAYDLDELRRFDAVILYGYDYGNSGKAWQLLSDYVGQGGSIFVDTGWQFWVPEWEFERAPAVLPVERLTWTDYGMSDAYQLGRTTIAGQVKVDDFKPLTWEGQPWAVSGAEPGDVREWGEVVLSTDGRPLVVAGEYGEGKVVWSGMNLVAHATYRGKNQEEIHLLHNLLGWLIEDESRGPAGQDPTVTRDHPDRVQFSLSTVPDGITWLYWREAFYPAWQAYLKTEDGERRELAIYRAGPGLMLMPIEGASGNALVELVWETPLVERMAALVSLMTLAALGVFLVDGALFGGKWFATIHKRFGWPSRGPKPRGSVEWLPDFTPEPAPQPEAALRSVSTSPSAKAAPAARSRVSSQHLGTEKGVGGAVDARSVQSPLYEARNLPTSEDLDAKGVIARWRRTRETRENE